MLLETGTQERLIHEVTTVAGVTSREGSVQSDSILVTVFVNSITSGSLSVSVNTLTDNGKELNIITFPSVSAPSTELLLKKSAVTMQRFVVNVTYTGVCDYEVYVRAISGAGEASVKIVGASNLNTSSISINTTPQVLIPSALTDRNGLTLKNWIGGGVLYVADSIPKLSTTDCWPVSLGEVWSLDVAAGTEIYAVASAGTIDVRIAESGT